MAVGVLVEPEIVLPCTVIERRVLGALLVDWRFEHGLEDVALGICLAILRLPAFLAILEHLVKHVG